MIENEKATDFEQQAANHQRQSFIREFYLFLRHNKKWWLAPIAAILLIFGLLMVLSGTGAAPFIYTLF